MTASPTPLFAESAGETDHSPDAGNMVSAAMPSEEIVRDIIQGVVDVATAEPTEWSACVDDATAAVLALFAPILAENNRMREDMIGLDADVAFANIRSRSMEARALAAEAALVAERERCAKVAEDHGALVSNEPIGKACSRNIAAAIRAQGE